MEKLTWYIPSEESSEPLPLVLGIPGFTHASERTRIDNLLKKLAYHGIVGVRINHPGTVVKKEGKDITFHFNLNAYVNNIRNAMNLLTSCSEVDGSRIGLLDSSVGSGIVGHWLAENERFNPACKVSISPLAGWPYYGEQQARETISRCKYDLIICSAKDRKQGVERIIPKSCLDEVVSTDAINALQISRRMPTIPMLTVIGTEDEEVSNSSMHRYHTLLADPLKSKVREWRTGHAVPEKRYEEEALRFFKKYLLNHQ